MRPSGTFRVGITVVLLMLLANTGATVVAQGRGGPPPFYLTVDPRSSSGFTVTQRTGLAQLTLLRGEEGKIPIAVASQANTPQNVTVWLSLSGCACNRILPPDVEVDSQPSPVSLPARENRSVVLTIKANNDAPTGAYLVRLYGADDRGTTVWMSGFWLVVGPYSPKQAFTLVDTNDFIAKNETWITLPRLEQDPNPRSTGYLGQAPSPPYLIIRSEGPPLDVQLGVVNLDAPKEITLSLPHSEVHVAPGAEEGAEVDVTVPFGTRLGTYHFQVVAKQGNEEHVAHFNLTLLPLPQPSPYNPPQVLINRTISGYQFTLYIAYRWGWSAGHMTKGTDAGFVYTIRPRNNSLSPDTYTSADVVVVNATSLPVTSGGKVLSLQMMRSGAPREFTVILERAGTYNVTMTGYAKQTNGTMDEIGSATASFQVVESQASLAETSSAQTSSTTTALSFQQILGSGVFQVMFLILVAALIAVVSFALWTRRQPRGAEGMAPFGPLRKL